MRGTNTPLYDKKRVGRRVKNAREDRNQTVERLAELIREMTGEPMTAQMVKNIEAGRKRVDAALLPVLSYVQDKSFAYYLLDDPSRPDSREAGLAQIVALPTRKRVARPIDSAITAA